MSLRKRKQKQRSLDCQKKLKLELEESLVALQEERKHSTNLQKQHKDTQARLLILQRRAHIKSSKTLVTPSHVVNKITACEVFVDALSIPPSLIQENGNLLGKGRFGTCTEVLLHGMVACAKTLKGSSYHSKSLILHEASMLSKVRHPHIALLIGVQTIKEPFQLITASYTIEGVSVSVYDTLSTSAPEKNDAAVELVREYLTLPVWLMLMRNLAEALAFIHSKSIVHRDLKSDNVVLSKKDETIQCILIDFGKSNYVHKVGRYQLDEKEKELYRRDHKHIAPDLVDGISDITTACDMYSYGRLFKNVIHYFPLPIDLVSVPIQKAVKKCLKYNYPERPSANQIVDLLKK